MFTPFVNLQRAVSLPGSQLNYDFALWFANYKRPNIFLHGFVDSVQILPVAAAAIASAASAVAAAATVASHIGWPLSKWCGI